MVRRQFKVDGLLVEYSGAETPTSDSPPFLLVHGACHGAWCWKFWMEGLAEMGREGYALSLRNHPGSRTVDPETYLKQTTIADYAEDVARVAENIGRPCVVVGHSMGGMVTQKYVEQNDLAAGMVLLTSSPPGQLGPIRSQPLPEDAPFLPPPELSAKMFFHTAEQEVIEWAVSQLVPESPSVMNRYSLDQGDRIDVSAIQCPTLVISAGLDGTPVPKDDRIARFYNADYILEADQGHDLMLEAGWRQVLEKMVAWSDTNCTGN